MTTLTLSLVSHTNVGKTTLARTLLGRDIGEVRDAPHVTEFADEHELLVSPQGDRLSLWDTPGFGDTPRLVRRMRQSGQPLRRLLSEVWDRWRDRPFWATQQALRHVRERSDLVLYLVNAAEPPAAAAYVGAEMELLGWLGKPVLVLLNQLGAPRAAAEEAAEVQAWREHLKPWPLVRDVLPLDAFARCWVHERVLLRALQQALPDADKAAAAARLAEAWAARQQRTFDAAMAEAAASLARLAGAREEVADSAGMGGRLREWGARLAGVGATGEAAQSHDPAVAARARLAAALDAEVQASTGRLLALHGLQGQSREQAQGEILARVARQFGGLKRVSEGRAALFGGALSGAAMGLKADIASGGLTLGGGMLAGGLLGAIGALGLARGVNRVRGSDRSWVCWSDEALPAMAEAALLRYLAVAHFGRGRGDWAQGEAPAHWREVVQGALAPQQAVLAALWRQRPAHADAQATAALAAALQAPLAAATTAALQRLYPGAG